MNILSFKSTLWDEYNWNNVLHCLRRKKKKKSKRELLVFSIDCKRAHTPSKGLLL